MYKDLRITFSSPQCDPIDQEIVKFLKDFDASHKTVRLIVIVV